MITLVYIKPKRLLATTTPKFIFNCNYYLEIKQLLVFYYLIKDINDP